MDELLKGFAARLYAWALPCGLALGAIWLLVIPRLYPDAKMPELDIKDSVIFVGISIVAGLVLSSLSQPLYRILEGYNWPEWARENGIRAQKVRKTRLKAITETKTGVEWGRAIENLARYPLDDNQVAPSRFGNAIRAGEQYGKSRFNLDSQTLWHDLNSVAPKYVQTEIESGRASVDFFVATLYLSILVGLLCLAVCALRGANEMALYALLAFAVAYACYELAVSATDTWTDPFRSLVNLGRVKLAAKLGLKIPKILEEEKIMWGLVTRYVYFADPTVGQALNFYRKDNPTDSSEDDASGE